MKHTEAGPLVLAAPMRSGTAGDRHGLTCSRVKVQSAFCLYPRLSNCTGVVYNARTCSSAMFAFFFQAKSLFNVSNSFDIERFIAPAPSSSSHLDHGNNPLTSNRWAETNM